MKTKQLQSEKGWASLIGLLFAAAIVAFLVLTYLRPGQQPEGLRQIDRAAGGAVKEAQIDTSSHVSVLESTKSKISAIEQMNQNRGDELMKEIGEMQQY